MYNYGCSLCCWVYYGFSTLFGIPTGSFVDKVDDFHLMIQKGADFTSVGQTAGPGLLWFTVLIDIHSLSEH